nr:hypothetical protein [Tanacetum cinerariifolium]
RREDGECASQEVLKALTSKKVELLATDAKHDVNDNVSSFSSEDLNFRGYTKEETKALRSIINNQVGKAIKNATYCDFTACDVPKFDGALEPIASTRWLSATEGAFHTSNYKEKNKVNFASNFLRDSAQMWWEGKVCEKGEEWIVNELWKKFNNLIRYCLEYHGNEKLKVERFQRMLCDDIQEAVFLFKCTTLDDLLSRARMREGNKECPNPKVIEEKPLKSIKETKVEKSEVPTPKARVYMMAFEEKC